MKKILNGLNNLIPFEHSCFNFEPNHLYHKSPQFNGQNKNLLSSRSTFDSWWGHQPSLMSTQLWLAGQPNIKGLQLSWQSAAFAMQRSGVQIPVSPPSFALDTKLWLASQKQIRLKKQILIKKLTRIFQIFTKSHFLCLFLQF